MRGSTLGLALLAALALPGCGGNSKNDLMTKGAGLQTAAEVERAFGKPAEKGPETFLGQPAERWTYKTPDGKVNFYVVDGGKIRGRIVAE